jgi:hypothetical protein
MSGFAAGAFDLAPGGYVFLTEGPKSFLIYGTDHPEGEPYQDPRSGKTFSYWDTTKVTRLSRFLGPSGVAAPFSLADLTSYCLGATASRTPDGVLVRPLLTDAQGRAVPLYGLDLTGRVGSRQAKLTEDADADGVPTGLYRGRFPGLPVKQLAVRGVVRVAGPTGLREERLDRSLSPTTEARPP